MKTNCTASLLLTALLLCAAALLPSTALAQQMNYQGRLTDNTGNALQDGQYTLTFTIYDAATAGAAVWGPFICDGAPGNGHAAKADLVSGRFNVILGPLATDGKPLTAAFVNTGTAPRFLGIKVGTGAEISPRSQILAAPEAIHALIADTVVAGGIGTAQIADGAITAEKISGGTGVWTGSGQNIFRLNGNVGIGTSTPGFPLNFATSLGDKISLFGTSGNHYGFGIQPGLLQIHTDISSSDVAFGSGRSAGFSETMRVKGNGNVGIGTSTPATKLDVVGDARVSGTVVASQAILSSGTLTVVGDVAVGGKAVFGGAVGIGTDTPQALLDVDGGIVCLVLVQTSDRDAKEQFKPVNPREVLAKVARLPISEWQFKSRDKRPADSARHIGPVAQDFHQAFSLGHDDKHIATVDADGVALAAIQGLHELVQDQRQAISDLEARNRDLEQRLAERLAALEKMMQRETRP